MNYDALLKLDGPALKQAVRGLSETVRARLLGEGTARAAQAKAAIQARYASAYADADFVAAAQAEGISVQQWVHNRIGAPDAATRPASGDFISDTDNAAIQALKAALGGR